MTESSELKSLGDSATLQPFFAFGPSKFLRSRTKQLGPTLPNLAQVDRHCQMSGVTAIHQTLEDSIQHMADLEQEDNNGFIVRLSKFLSRHVS